MREFYVYGFKKREEYTRKSLRSYDNERRRIESILGNYIQFHQTENGKNVFLSIDSRITEHNPLYQAWKIKSFTDGDITFHFIIMDILESAKESLSIHEITKQVDQYLSVFESPKVFDESTILSLIHIYLCRLNHTKSKTLKRILNNEWVTLTAQIHSEYNEAYDKTMPILTAIRIEKSEPPKEQLVYF